MKYVQHLINPLNPNKKILKRVFEKVNKGIIIYSAFPKSSSQHILNLIGISSENKTNLGMKWGSL